MRCRRALAVAAALMLAAGCSGDDAAGDSTTTTDAAPTSTTSSETTAPPATAPPSTVATTTTSGPPPDPTTSTSEPTTTTSSAPGTTLDPDDRAGNTLAIIETVERSFEIYNAALNDPFNNSNVAALKTVYTQRLVEGWMNIIDDYRANNYRAVPSPEMPSEYDVDVNSVEINLSSGTASVQACHLDTSIKVQVGGNADGSDRIVEDAVTEQVEQLELLREGGRWLINAAKLPDESEVVTPCG